MNSAYLVIIGFVIGLLLYNIVKTLTKKRM